MLELSEKSQREVFIDLMCHPVEAEEATTAVCGGVVAFNAQLSLVQQLSSLLPRQWPKE